MSRRIARPYAAALFRVVARQGTDALRECERQLHAVAELLRSHPAMLRVFERPGVTAGDRQRLLAALAGELALRPEVRRLLAALEQHYRLRFVGDVAATLRDLVDRREGLVRGTVELPEAPSAAQLAALAAALGPVVGARVELAAKVRPELLAGFVVRVGSRVYDGSVRAQLQRFARGGGQR